MATSKNTIEGEKQTLIAIGEMPRPFRSMGKKLHNLIKSNAPILIPRTWYGMPAYANREGKVICFFRFFQQAPYYDTYMKFGFTKDANLDEGAMWPTDFALKRLTSAEETKLVQLLKKAVE